MPATLVDREDFKDLLRICNPDISPLLVGSDCVMESVKTQFRVSRNLLKDVLSKSLAVNITCDEWSSSNNVPILGITAHWIDGKFRMNEVILAMQEIEGAKTGANLAKYFIEILEKFNINDKIYCVTADNASTNGVMAREIANEIEEFKNNTNLLGCVAHVINLVACAGLAVFSKKLGETTSVNIDDILEDDTFDQIDAPGALSRLMGFITAIMKTPKRKKSFEKLVESELSRYLGLIRNVETRWNSDLNALKRALELKNIIDLKCLRDLDMANFSLTPAEWELIAHLTRFLEPFEKATNMLSQSTYTSIDAVLPVYEWLECQLDKVSCIILHSSSIKV